MKQKSLKQIYGQAENLMHTTALDHWTESGLPPKAESRIDKLNEILERYDKAFLKHFNQKYNLTNEQFNTTVPRSVYAGY